MYSSAIKFTCLAINNLVMQMGRGALSVQDILSHSNPYALVRGSKFLFLGQTIDWCLQHHHEKESRNPILSSSHPRIVSSRGLTE